MHTPYAIWYPGFASRHSPDASTDSRATIRLSKPVASTTSFARTTSPDGSSVTVEPEASWTRLPSKRLGATALAATVPRRRRTPCAACCCSSSAFSFVRSTCRYGASSRVRSSNGVSNEPPKKQSVTPQLTRTQSRSSGSRSDDASASHSTRHDP